MGLFKKKEKNVVNNNAQNTNVETNKIVNTATVNVEPNKVVNGPIKVETPVSVQNTVKESPVVSVESKLPEAPTNENKDNNQKVETKIKKKRDLSFLIYVFGVVILFVIFMPIIRNFFVPKINPEYETNTELESDNLEFGYIVIGKEKSYMKEKKIKFYNFKMYENNNLVFNYIADSAVKNANNLNIYILIYNKYGTLVHKEKFNQSEKIKKKVEDSYSIALSSLTYKEAIYVKVEVMVEELREKEIICKSTETKENTKINNEMSYKFVDGMLQSYSLLQKYDSAETIEKLDNNYKGMYNKLKETNILEQDLSLNNNSIYYKIDYSYFDKGETSFNLRYAKNDYIDYVKAVELKREWKCE